MKIVASNKKLNYEILSVLFGEDEVFKFEYLKPYVSGKKKLTKKLVDDTIDLVDSIWQYKKIVNFIIDSYVNLNRDDIKKNNNKVEVFLTSYYKNIIPNKESIVEFVKKGKFSSQKYDKNFLKKIKSYYLEEIKYRQNNSYLPIEFVRHIFSYFILDFMKNDLSLILRRRTLESDIDANLEKFLIYDFNSKSTTGYGDWFASLYKENVFESLLFYKGYLGRCENGFKPALSLWSDYLKYKEIIHTDEYKDELIYDDDYNIFYDTEKSEAIEWKVINLYEIITKKKLVNFVKCFSDKEYFTISRNEFLVQPNFDVKDIFYLDAFDKMIRLHRFALKELTSALKFINDKSRKCYSQLNNIGCVLGEQKENNKKAGYFAIPKIIPMKTRTNRFAADIHTISGGDDGQLLMISDDSDVIGAYFDVSQAEVRMIATLTQDPNLIDLYKAENADAYKNMALSMYPYLSDPVYSSQLKEIRNEFKTAFLSYLYRAQPKTIAKRNGMDIDRVIDVCNSIREKYNVAEKFAKYLVEYVEKNNTRKTYLGEKSIIYDNENKHTTAINYVNQSITTLLLNSAFFNIFRAALINNIYLSFKYTVHDSNKSFFKIKDLFKVTILFKKYFRYFIKDIFGVDFKYDLDLLVTNYRDHTLFDYDHLSGRFKLSGYSHHVNKVLSGLEEKFEILKSKEVKVEEVDPILNFTSTTPKKEHRLYPISLLEGNIKKKSVIACLKKPLKFNFI